jgi:hypothetical protein
VKGVIEDVTLLLRFIFGVIFAGGFVLWGGIPLRVGATFVVAVGIVATIWGDRFLLGFIALFRYFR